MGKFLLKMLLNGIIAVPLVLWFTRATLWEAIFAAVMLCIVAYVVGDRTILPAAGNLIAAAADLALTFFFLWIVSAMLDWNLSLTGAFWISLGIGLVELLYHSMLEQDDLRRTAA